MPDDTRPALTIDRRRIATFALFAALVLILFGPVLTKLLAQWLDDENYRHGLLVPIISAVMLYQRRDSLRDARSNDGTVGGWLICVAAGGLLVAGTAAGELMTTRLAFPTLIIGIIAILCGMSFVRAAAFPLLFLYMMIPLPYIIYYKIAFPLQLVSAKLSATILDGMGVSVMRHGNVLLLPNYALEVVAACSGLRSLMTMVTLALIIGAFSELSPSRRAILLALSIPTAIAANTVRLILTGLGAYLIGPAFADGFLHTASGVFVFATGFAMLMIAFAILRRRA